MMFDLVSIKVNIEYDLYICILIYPIILGNIFFNNLIELSFIYNIDVYLNLLNPFY